MDAARREASIKIDEESAKWSKRAETLDKELTTTEDQLKHARRAMELERDNQALLQKELNKCNANLQDATCAQRELELVREDLQIAVQARDAMELSLQKSKQTLQDQQAYSNLLFVSAQTGFSVRKISHELYSSPQGPCLFMSVSGTISREDHKT